MSQELVGFYYYSLLDIFWWNFKGRWITIAHNKGWPSWLQLSFPVGAPGWWLEVHEHEWMWTRHLVDGKPDYWFCHYYREAAEHHLIGWIADKATSIATPLVNAVSNLLGTLRYGYVTFSVWIGAIRGRVGAWVPFFADHLADATVRLYNWFPADIVNAWKSWDTIWAEIKGEVWSWALARFDAARNWVANHAPWVIDWINFLGTWYNAVGAWVTAFKNDPFGTVTGWLGVAWSAWLGVQAGIVDFYNNVWVPFSVDLHDFFDHPVLFLYDAFDEEANDYIETLSRWVGRVAEKIITWSWENS